MGKEISLCCYVQELDDIPMSYDATTASFRKCFGRNNPPPVVLVGVTVTSDLLTYKAIRSTPTMQVFVMGAYLGYLYDHHHNATGTVRDVSVGKPLCLYVSR